MEYKLTKGTLLLLLISSMAGSAFADSIIFSIQGIPFCTGDAFAACGGQRIGTEFDTVSVTGVGTPLQSGVTVPGRAAGFSWIAPAAGSDSHNWYFGATDIIIEAEFDFSGPPFLQPGDIPPFTYLPVGATGPFSIAKDGSPLQFAAPIDLGIDPRLALFTASSRLVHRAGVLIIPLLETFTGTGSPTGTPGFYMFDAQVTATFVPEPGSLLLLLTVLGILGTKLVTTRQRQLKAGNRRQILF